MKTLMIRFQQTLDHGSKHLVYIDIITLVVNSVVIMVCINRMLEDSRVLYAGYR